MKLGPRLIGTLNDWDLAKFSKETLFSIIHDSISLRSGESVLFTTDNCGNPYKILIYNIKRTFYDIHYSGECYSFCIFIPCSFKIKKNYKLLLDNFQWYKNIDISGGISRIKQSFHDILKQCVVKAQPDNNQSVVISLFL